MCYLSIKSFLTSQSSSMDSEHRQSDSSSYETIQQNQIWDSSDEENGQPEIDYEEFYSHFTKEASDWLSEHGTDILRAEISLYLKTKQMVVESVLRTPSTPGISSAKSGKTPLKKQKRFHLTSVESGDGEKKI